jgi:hypothetical protein
MNASFWTTDVVHHLQVPSSSSNNIPTSNRELLQPQALRHGVGNVEGLARNYLAMTISSLTTQTTCFAPGSSPSSF